jgi:hypothetical protein
MINAPDFSPARLVTRALGWVLALLLDGLSCVQRLYDWCRPVYMAFALFWAPPLGRYLWPDWGARPIPLPRRVPFSAAVPVDPMAWTQFPDAQRNSVWSPEVLVGRVLQFALLARQSSPVAPPDLARCAGLVGVPFSAERPIQLSYYLAPCKDSDPTYILTLALTPDKYNAYLVRASDWTTGSWGCHVTADSTYPLGVVDVPAIVSRAWRAHELFLPAMNRDRDGESPIAGPQAGGAPLCAAGKSREEAAGAPL